MHAAPGQRYGCVFSRTLHAAKLDISHRIILLLRCVLACAGLAVLAACGGLPPGQQTSSDGSRIALLIGNNDYRHWPKLYACEADVNRAASAFSAVGYQTIVEKNLTAAELRASLRSLQARIRPDTTVVIYFSGHGVEIAGQNYLCGVDCNLAGDVGATTVRAEECTAAMARSNAPFLFLDTCRERPDGASRGKFIGNAAEHFAAGRSSPRQVVVYATAAGDPARELPDGSSSMFNGKFCSAVRAKPHTRDLLPMVARQVEDSARANGFEQHVRYEMPPHEPELCPAGGHQFVLTVPKNGVRVDDFPPVSGLVSKTLLGPNEDLLLAVTPFLGADGPENTRWYIQARPNWNDTWHQLNFFGGVHLGDGKEKGEMPFAIVALIAKRGKYKAGDQVKGLSEFLAQSNIVTVHKRSR